MPAAKAKARKPAPKKGAAARSKKKKAEVPTVEFRGLKVTVPSEPDGALFWDLSELISASESESGNGLELLAQLKELLESLVGVEQSRAIRRKVKEDGLKFDQTIDQIMTLCLAVFEADSGLAQGE